MTCGLFKGRYFFRHGPILGPSLQSSNLAIMSQNNMHHPGDPFCSVGLVFLSSAQIVPIVRRNCCSQGQRIIRLHQESPADNVDA